MSLDDEQTQASITAYEAALNLFTDRIQERRLFADYLNDDPPKNTILFFHGDGGNGKSWLLRILRERYCKQLPPASWAYVRDQEDGKAFLAHFEGAEDFKPVPCAYLDFADINHDNPPRDAFHGPRLLRKQLGRQGLSFPLYDFALLLYWTKGRGESRASAKALFPAEEVELVDKLLNCVYESKTIERVSAVLKLFDAHFGERFGLYLRKRKLEDSEWKRLESLDPNAQLYFELPRLFALDLNAALANGDDRRSGLQPATAANHGLKPAPSSPSREAGHNRPARIVLLFDTHEAFWGVGRVHESSASYFLADEWLRRLLRALDLDKGIVAVVAGREPPRWADAPINPQDGKRTDLPSSHLDTQLIGHLEPDDADEYLQKAGVADATLRQALVRQAEVAPGQVHPLYVGLCGDIVLAAAAGKGETLDPASFDSHPDIQNKGRALMDQLLSYCNDDLADTVRALAAARAFDRELFCALGDKLRYHNTETSYKQLTRFSFVWPSQKGEGWARIHDLARRVLWEIDEEQTTKADAALEDWFRARHAQGDESAIVEAIYHANRRDWQRGYLEWNEVFESALQNICYALCANLLELRPVLWLETDLARGLSAYHAGEFALAMSDHATARSYLDEAMACYKQALQSDPDDIAAHTSLGNALWKLAELLTQLTKHESALTTYRQAIAAHGEALRCNANYFAAHNNQANALKGLADLLAGLSQYRPARDTYAQAVAAYNKALSLDRHNVAALMNRGTALYGLANTQFELSEYEPALENYTQAIAAYDEALIRAPGDVEARTNRGTALQALAELLAGFAEHGAAALNIYGEAIATFDEVLHRAPDYVDAHCNKGSAWLGLAILLAGSDKQKSPDAYREAVAAFDEALRLAPNTAVAHNSLGSALNRWAGLLIELGDLPAAQQKNAQAQDACGRALALAPNQPVFLWAMAETQMLASHLETLTQGAAAPALWRAALQTIEQGLRIAPDHPQLVQLRQEVQEVLGQASDPSA